MTSPDSEERPALGDYAVTTPFGIPRAGALLVMKDTGWDHALKVTGDGESLVGHAAAVLLASDKFQGSRLPN